MRASQSGKEMTVYLSEEDVERLKKRSLSGRMSNRSSGKEQFFSEIFLEIDGSLKERIFDVVSDDQSNYAVTMSRQCYEELVREGFVAKFRYAVLPGPTITVFKESY